MPDDATESVVTHSSRLQPSIVCLLQLHPWCSAALVLKFTTLQSWNQGWTMKVQVSLETTIEPRDLVYYLNLETVLHGRKAKILPLDHHRLVYAVYCGGLGDLPPAHDIYPAERMCAQYSAQTVHTICQAITINFLGLWWLQVSITTQFVSTNNTICSGIRQFKFFWIMQNNTIPDN